MSQFAFTLIFFTLPIAMAWNCGYEGYMCCRGSRCRYSNLICMGTNQNNPGACFRRNRCGGEGQPCCYSSRSPKPVSSFCSEGLECTTIDGAQTCRSIGIQIGGRRFLPGMSLTQLPSENGSPMTTTTTALTGTGVANVGSGTTYNEASGIVEDSKENGGRTRISASQAASAAGTGVAAGTLNLGALGSIQSRGEPGADSVRQSTSAAEGSLTFSASGEGENRGTGIQQVDVDSNAQRSSTSYLGSAQVQGSGPVATASQFSVGQSGQW